MSNRRKPLELKLYGDEAALYRESGMSDVLRDYLAQGGMLLRPAIPRTLGGPRLVRNVATGEPLLCCHSPCDRYGDDRIQIAEAHPQPRWLGEKLVWIFCSHGCRRAFTRGTPRERYT